MKSQPVAAVLATDHRRHRARLVLAMALLAWVALPTAAQAAAPKLELSITRSATNLPPGEDVDVFFSPYNMADTEASGPLTIVVDPLPAGLSAVSLKGSPRSSWTCDLPTLTCTTPRPLPPGGSGFPDRDFNNPGVNYDPVELRVAVAPGASGSARISATVSAAGAPEPASASRTALISSQEPGFGIVPGSLKADSTDRAGNPVRQAGETPFLNTVEFELNQRAIPGPSPVPLPGDEGIQGVGEPIGTVRDVRVKLPRGLIGNPGALPKCPLSDFAIIRGSVGTRCTQETQIGVIDAGLFTLAPVRPNHYPLPVYNLIPPRGVVADFGFALVGRPVHITVRELDPKDHTVIATVENINETIPIRDQRLTLWGNPADPAHDALRWDETTLSATGGWGSTSKGLPGSFLALPTECGVAGHVEVAVDSWQSSGAFSAPAASDPITLTGCEKLPFDPSFEASFTGPAAGTASSPAGIRVALGFAQTENPNNLRYADLKDAKVTLPAGVTINPSSADGLAACGDAQLGLESNDPAACPDASKIGTISAESPLIDEPLTGSVYLRPQNSSDPESGEMFRLAIELSNPDLGLRVKLAGQVRADAATGQLKTTFSDNPQVPVSKLVLELKSGSRSPLATPQLCGTYESRAELSSWSGQSRVLTDSAQITSAPNGPACPRSLIDRPFGPTMQAGTDDPVGGKSSPFSFVVARADGEQELKSIDSVELPTGLLGRVAGVALCAEADAAQGTCSPASRVGRVQVAAGVGPTPLWLPQAGLRPTAVYLTGPYKGAPFGLSTVVPAQAGPFDLGTVVVRSALFVDPIDAHVTAKTDPLPHILDGIPLQVREVRLVLDRQGFTLNPTSCAPKAIGSVLGSVDGATVTRSVRFQVGDCASLGLQPALGLSLSGKGQTTDGKHPAITAVLTQKPGQANLKKVRVALPLSLALDPDNANGLCEFVDGSKPTPTCPKASIVGSVMATTPILDEPLSGPVYFVKNIRKDPKTGREIRTLPKLVIPLVGQNGVRLTLTGTSAVEKDQLVTVFDNIPDAPVSSFKMTINGGKGGILTVSGADICKSTQVADQQIDGQNGKAADVDVFIQTPSCPLKVLTKKVGKRSVAVKVGGLGAGKVTVTGKGIKKTTKTISKSTVATITAKRSKGKPGKVTVSFDPAGPAKARKTSK